MKCKYSVSKKMNGNNSGLGNCREAWLWKRVLGRRVWAAEIDGVSIEVSWLWDFRSVELSVDRRTVARGLGHAALRKGVRSETSLGPIELKLSGSSDVAGGRLKIYLIDRAFIGPAGVIVDTDTRLAKHGLIVAFFGIFQAAFSLFAEDLNSMESLVSWSAVALFSTVSLGLAFSDSSVWAALAMVFGVSLPSLLLLSVGVLMFDNWLLWTLWVVPGVIYSWTSGVAALETWKILCTADAC